MGAEGGELGAVHGDGDQLVRAVAVGGLVDRLAQGLARLRRQVVAAGAEANDQPQFLQVGHELRGHRHRVKRQVFAGVFAQHGGLGGSNRVPSGRITSCSHRRGSPSGSGL